MNKRGFSQIISVVLTILIAICGIIIIAAFVRMFIVNSLNDVSNGETLTLSSNIVSESVNVDYNNKIVSFFFKDNSGKANIIYFYVVLTDSSSVSVSFRINVSLTQPFGSVKLTVDYSSSVLADLAKIEVYPVYIINGKEVTASVPIEYNLKKDKFKSSSSSEGDNSNLIVVTYAKDFGAIGDGIVDDSLALQKAIDATPEYSKLIFQEGANYRLNKGLVINKSIVLEGNGSNLIIHRSDWPENNQIWVESPLDMENTYTWTENVVKGQRRFNVSISVNKIKAGDLVFVGLGNDPYDPNEQHYTYISKVLENDGNSILLDIDIPYDIIQGNRNHTINKVVNLIENLTIKNLNFYYGAGHINNAQIYLVAVHGALLENLGGNFTIAVNIVDSRNVHVNNVSGNAFSTHSAAGRIFVVWNSENILLENSKIETTFDQPVVFLESWARNVSVRNLDIIWNHKSNSISDVFHITGGSYDIHLNNINIVNPFATVNVVDSGGVVSDYKFEVLKVSGLARYIRTERIEDLSYNGTHYDKPIYFERNYSLDSSSSKDYFLFDGIIKNMTVKVDSVKGLNSLKIFSPAPYHFYCDLLNNLVSGVNLQMPSGCTNIGLDYPFNDPSNQKKYLSFSTNSSIASGTKLKISGWYFTIHSEKKIFDSLIYGNMPILNLPKMATNGYIWYEGYNSSNPLSESQIKQFAHDTKNSGIDYIVIDIEDYSHSIDIGESNPKSLNNIEGNITEQIKIIDWIKEAEPTMKVGSFGYPYTPYYAIMLYNIGLAYKSGEELLDPEAVYYGAEGFDEVKGYFMDLQMRNNAIKRYLDHLDFAAPDFYVHVDFTKQKNVQNWEIFSRAAIEESRRLMPNKPIYPFVMPVYTPEVNISQTSGSYLPKEGWKTVVKSSWKNADGAVLWGGWNFTTNTEQSEGNRETWNPNAEWWEVIEEESYKN